MSPSERQRLRLVWDIPRKGGTLFVILLIAIYLRMMSIIPNQNL
jgi:hypothetical protein